MDIKLLHGDCLELMKDIPDKSVDLTVTSPPYDNLRSYNGNISQWSFAKFKAIAKELYRVTKQGGVVVWVVGDATIKGSETGTSFRQALYFKEIGFNLHDTMIWKKHSPHPPNVRYWQCFEYMFVLSKGKPKTFKPITQTKTKFAGYKNQTVRKKDGSIELLEGNAKDRIINAQQTKQRIMDNIWEIPSGYGRSTKDKIAYNHPAIFPEQLAEDHIISWSNPGDIVFDPFMGSGTTGKMAVLNGRNFIGIELDDKYFEIAKRRISEARNKPEQITML
jgi:site-specific DNA-methyltransferase (adenine-specific)